MIKRARLFFAETIVPIEKIHHAVLKADIRVHQLTKTLCWRTVESTALTRRLKRNILLRQGAEKSLKKSRKRYGACSWLNYIACRSTCGI